MWRHYVAAATGTIFSYSLGRRYKSVLSLSFSDVYDFLPNFLGIKSLDGLIWNYSVCQPNFQFLFLGQSYKVFGIIEQVAWNKSSLLLRIEIQNTQTLQLFTKIIVIGNVTKLKGNKLAAVLRLSWIFSTFLFKNKKCHST